ncbi:MAG: glycosyltransferase [Fibrobacter sp.]|nr:glycosyltransferase [Fibrobacter sp.]
MKQKRIFWITGSSFIDVDLPIVPKINENFDITWIVIRQQDCWFPETELLDTFQKHSINGIVLNIPGRLRSFASFKVFFKLIKMIERSNPDVCYVNYLGVPYLWPLLLCSTYDSNKIIYPCHDFMDHVGVKNRNIYSLIKRIIFKKVNHFQFFSRTQQKLFLQKYPRKSTFYAPLYLKGFGNPVERSSQKEKIQFLFFGSIRENKGIEYLIEAGNRLYETYPDKFSIKICGGCSYWEELSKKIKHNNCFDLHIRRIENQEIPQIFANTDYLLLPYLDVTQSGPLLISYFYRVPVIASDHEGFREYIEDGVTGFLHKNKSVDEMVSIMSKIIEGKVEDSYIKENLEKFIQNEISIEEIQKKYEIGLTSI